MIYSVCHKRRTIPQRLTMNRGWEEKNTQICGPTLCTNNIPNIIYYHDSSFSTPHTFTCIAIRLFTEFFIHRQNEFHWRWTYDNPPDSSRCLGQNYEIIQNIYLLILPHSEVTICTIKLCIRFWFKLIRKKISFPCNSAEFFPIFVNDHHRWAHSLSVTGDFLARFLCHFAIL